MVNMECLHATDGDRSRIFVEDDDDLAQRDKLAEGIEALLSSGTALFLVINSEQSLLIKGYDAQTHEWLLSSQMERPNTPPEAIGSEPQQDREKRKPGRPRRSAQDTTVVAVPPRSGG